MQIRVWLGLVSDSAEAAEEEPEGVINTIQNVPQPNLKLIEFVKAHKTFEKQMPIRKVLQEFCWSPGMADGGDENIISALSWGRPSAGSQGLLYLTRLGFHFLFTGTKHLMLFFWCCKHSIRLPSRLCRRISGGESWLTWVRRAF